MFKNECVHLDSFKNTNIKITCRVDEWTRLIERMMNYDELIETINQSKRLELLTIVPNCCGFLR